MNERNWLQKCNHVLEIVVDWRSLGHADWEAKYQDDPIAQEFGVNSDWHWIIEDFRRELNEYLEETRNDDPSA
jgi:hypothetical protein